MNIFLLNELVNKDGSRIKGGDKIDQDNNKTTSKITTDDFVHMTRQGISRYNNYGRVYYGEDDESNEKAKLPKKDKKKRNPKKIEEKNIKLSKKEKEIVNDILKEVNNLNEINLNKVKEKLTSYGKKGLLTLSILLSIMNGLQANPSMAKNIMDVGVEMIDPTEQNILYSAVIGYTQELIDVAMEKGDTELAGVLKEVKLHYEALRDSKTPKTLSPKANKAAHTILKKISETDDITSYVEYGSGITTSLSINELGKVKMKSLIEDIFTKKEFDKEFVDVKRNDLRLNGIPELEVVRETNPILIRKVGALKDLIEKNSTSGEEKAIILNHLLGMDITDIPYEYKQELKKKLG